jgi:zinc and cadmium transporter
VNPAVASLVSVAVVSAASAIGVLALANAGRRGHQPATFFVSFAVGGLLGDAFFHLVPEAFAAAEHPHDRTLASLLILGGMLLAFVLEKLVRHRHAAPGRPHRSGDAPARPEFAAINIAGDACHNFVDGVLIGASWQVSPSLGLATTIAVLLHEIPQELGDFGVLLRSGMSTRRAVLVNLASAGTAIVGAIAALVLGAAASDSVRYLVPITAGTFVYLAAADLIPELQNDRSWRALATQTPAIAAGIAVMGLLTAIG